MKLGELVPECLHFGLYCS